MRATGAVDWWFTSRKDGSVVVGQVPNSALSVWLAATVWRYVAAPSATERSVLDGIAAGALLAWALDEIVRGVNPFRRLLGGVVFTLTFVHTAMRLA